MPTFKIPARGTLYLTHLVLDLNGTIAIDGQVVPGVAERVAALREQGMNSYLLTADTLGHGAETSRALGLTLHRLRRGGEAEQKEAFVAQLGDSQVVAIGNGANDTRMLRTAAIGIAVLQAEGVAMTALQAADVIVPDINAALDLLLKPQRLIATLRT